jgi:WD40 repeat protein
MSKEFSDIHEESITSLIFSRFDRNRILTASSDGTLKLFDIRMEKVLKRFEDQDIVTQGSSHGSSKALLSSGG